MRHLVITVHGIRTYGQWGSRLGEILVKLEPTIEVENYSFGFMSFIAFLFPFIRSLKVRRFQKLLEEKLAEQEWDRVDIVAHSFGTFIVGNALKRLSSQPERRINTVILCGSVLRSEFEWDFIVPQCVGRLVNECGNEDGALIASQFFVWGTGAAGRLGFYGLLGSRFQNRFYEGGHSLYFTEEFMKARWASLLTQAEPIEAVDQRRPLTTLGGVLNTLLANAQPVKIALYLGVFTAAVVWVSNLKGSAKRQAQRAEEQRNVALKTQSIFLADLANQNTRAGDAVGGALLALEGILPDVADKPRPPVEEAGDALLRARHRIAETNVIPDSSLPNGVAMSPDGSLIATANWDRVVRVWNAKTREKIGELVGHGDQVNSIAFSADGKQILTASNDRSARLWDVGARKEIGQFQGHERFVNSARFSPDSRNVLTASDDKTARIWDTATYQEIGRLDAGEYDVLDAAYSQDGTQFATALFDGSIIVRDTRSRETLFTLGEEDCQLRLSIAYSPKNDRLAAGCDDGSARIWNLQSKTAISLQGHGGSVNSVAFEPNGRWVATASDDGSVRLWDAETGKPFQTFRGHEKKVTSVTFSSDGRQIATTSWDDTTRIWSVDRGTLRGHTQALFNAAFSPDGRSIVTSSLDGSAIIWDAGSGRMLHKLPHNKFLPPRAAVFSPDGRHILTTSGRSARLWSAETRREEAQLRHAKGTVMSIAISPDSKQILTGADDKTAILWNVDQSDKPAATLASNGESIWSVAFSPNGASFVTASPHKILLWNRDGQSEIGVFDWPPGDGWGWVRSVAFSPDSKYLAAVHNDGTWRLWDVVTRALRATVKISESPANSVAFNSDGRFVVTGSDDGIARIFDVGSGRRVGVLEGHEKWIKSVAFSPDGSRIVTASEDQTAHLFPFFPTVDALVKDTRQLLPRCLSPAERTKATLGDSAPPPWCVQKRLWPYDSENWSVWLRETNKKQAGVASWTDWIASAFGGAAAPKTTIPRPDSPEWADWLRAHLDKR